ncbi:Glycosyltransferase [Melia azedarach]|uniref:Glycosyltransferase n=1 Tax=Melia azedarach TaxID=155640 RepID=A0ACC1XUE8_MELAZ|nr:Glycosyltransferase [Melia azedarach]
MGAAGATKPHAVCVPFPAQGHVTPMMQLAKLLHSRGFHTIPDGLPPSDRDTTQDIPSLCASIRRTCLAAFLELLANLNSSADVPPVTCVVSDGGMGFGVEAARKLGITGVQLWPAAACSLMACLQYEELVRRGIVPFENEKFLTDGTLDTPADWISGMNNMRLKDFPTFMRVTDTNDIMFDYIRVESQNCLKSSAIIFNTFDDFESEVLEVIASKFPNIYTIGPLLLLCRHLPKNELTSFRPSLWKEDSECLRWLDNKEPNSIVYVNYGSITVMTDQHLKEFAWGLANSKHSFLWIVRPDVVMGDSAILPEEFFEEIKDRGMIANWCPQDKVLLHPSIGVFLTHCGWNSTMESVCGGVPVICWPFFGDQQTNCRYSCTTWGMGMEVNTDVKREDIAKLVKEMMEGNQGKQIRQKAQEWKKKAVATTEIGGGSYQNFDRCIKEVLHYDH